MPAAAARDSLLERFAATFATSRKMAGHARSIFPGGVTHDLRHLEPFPLYVDHARGAYKWDVDGHRLIDYWAGHGALLLGHSHPDVVGAVQQQMSRGTHYGACHELEMQWGEWVKKLVPSADKVRFVASGTEATLMALRLARIFTGKPKVLKFQGHFHGWQDYLVPGLEPPYPSRPVPGVPDGVAANTVVVPANQPDVVDSTLAADADIGCVILEPTGCHWGSVPIRGPFLQQLREITRHHGRVLIFDEVVTGFRVHPGGAQAHYGVTPDLTTLAKVLAGGLPGGAVAGRADVMELLEFRPGKPKMAHPGTFNANPLSAAAGTTALEIVSTGEPCRRATELTALLVRKLNELFAARGLDWVAYHEFSGFRIVTGYDGPPPTGDDFTPYGGDPARLDLPRDARLHAAFRQAALLNGVDLIGLGGLLTAAHTETDVEATAAAIDGAVIDLQREGVI